MLSTVHAMLFVGALAQPLAPLVEDETLASLGDATVTVADVDAEFLRIPEPIAEGWIEQPGRIGDAMTTLLLDRAVVLDLAAPGAPDLEGLEELGRQAEDEALVDLWLRARLQPIVDSVGDDEMRSHFEANRDAFAEPATMTLRHVLVSSRYVSTSRAREELQAARDQLSAGDLSFDALYERFAEESAAPARVGQLLERIAVDQADIAPAFLEAAKALALPGDVSGPVVTQFGVHLIELRERFPETPASFASVAEDVRTALLRQRLEGAREAALAPWDGDVSAVADRLRQTDYANHPRIRSAMRRAAERAILAAYRTEVLEFSPEEVETLARERFLTFRDNYDQPARAALWVVPLDELMLGEHRVAELASTYEAGGADGPDLRDHVYDALYGDVDYEPRYFSDSVVELRPELRAAVEAAGGEDLPARLTVDVGPMTLLVQLVGWQPGARPEFDEIKDQVAAEVAQAVGGQRWGMIVAKYRRLPLDAEPERIGLLHQRYMEGLDAIEVPSLLVP